MNLKETRQGRLREASEWKKIQFRCLSIAAYVHTSELFFICFLRLSASAAGCYIEAG